MGLGSTIINSYYYLGDEELAVPVTFNLKNVFSDLFVIDEARETYLAGNKYLDDQLVEEISMKPLEIRTFIIRVSFTEL